MFPLYQVIGPRDNSSRCGSVPGKTLHWIILSLIVMPTWLRYTCISLFYHIKWLVLLQKCSINLLKEKN
jgi:hypothetical protein